jgi:hypothetical protein
MLSVRIKLPKKVVGEVPVPISSSLHYLKDFRARPVIQRDKRSHPAPPPQRETLFLFLFFGRTSDFRDPSCLIRSGSSTLWAQSRQITHLVEQKLNNRIGGSSVFVPYWAAKQLLEGRGQSGFVCGCRSTQPLTAYLTI